jgi:hypothetical protein
MRCDNRQNWIAEAKEAAYADDYDYYKVGLGRRAPVMGRQPAPPVAT